MAEEQTPGWIEACFKAMGLREGSSSENSLDAHEASRVLAKYGAINASIQKELETFVIGGEWGAHTAMVTLARGWPTSDVLKKLWSEVKNSPDDGAERYELLVAMYSEPEEFVIWLRQWLKLQSEASRRYFHSDVRWFILRRCFQDVRLTRLLIEELTRTESTDEWITLPWLIRGSGLEDAEHQLMEWAEQCWSKIDKGNWCCVGYDLFLGRYRSLRVSLLELLSTSKQYVLG
ncbi:hypothetical protein [Verrucomicrobium sp. BvORR034]|uniref:hypothetical protein n=1 Tax=Verrucomicrobium sp. BvORR034 TaxID=1396418 RepID=UPI000678F9A7|nr:hypothetical protein [Verrucomicrobium sp. BvORR034]